LNNSPSLGHTGLVGLRMNDMDVASWVWGAALGRERRWKREMKMTGGLLPC
jgi:hypothetical protein